MFPPQLQSQIESNLNSALVTSAIKRRNLLGSAMASIASFVDFSVEDDEAKDAAEALVRLYCFEWHNFVAERC